MCEKIAGYQPEAIAVCFLHSYVDPSHEQIMGRALRRAFPKAYVSLSHEILRQYREYERSSTTVVNFLYRPAGLHRIKKRLEGRLERPKFPGTLPDHAIEWRRDSRAASRAPVGLMEFGPVGGIIAPAEIGRRSVTRKSIAFDMGGTTAKAALVRDSQPATRKAITSAAMPRAIR